MRDSNKPNAKSQAHLREYVEFQSALQKAGFAEATQKIYLRDFNKFIKRLDRKTPATATLKEAKRYTQHQRLKFERVSPRGSP